MKLRAKRVIFAALAVLLIVLGVIFLAFMPPADPPETEARRLVSELHEPTILAQWAIKLGLMRGPREPSKVVADLTGLGQEAVPPLIEALKDDSMSVRLFSAKALGHIGPEAKDAVLALVGLMADTWLDVRTEAEEALQKIGPVGRSDIGLPILIQALKGEHKYVRLHAALCLGDVGVAAKRAIPVLTEALEDDDRYVRMAAAEALKKVQDAPTTRKAGTTQPGGKT